MAQGGGVGELFRNDLAMPWLAGEGDQFSILPKQGELFPLHEMLTLAPLAYIGYLHPGFSPALESGAFRPHRVSLALRAGWRAVAVTASLSEAAHAKRLAPFVAPTWAGPRRTAPLGFALFSSPWISAALPLGELGVSRSSLEWSRRMVSLLSEKSPVFCDPELELRLELTEDDDLRSADPYRAPDARGKIWNVLGALSAPRWERKA